MFQFSQNKIHTKPYDLRRCLIKFNHNLKVYNKNFQRKANLIRSINDLLRGDYKRFEYHIIMDDQFSRPVKEHMVNKVCKHVTEVVPR
jgi:hypothetical protein